MSYPTAAELEAAPRRHGKTSVSDASEFLPRHRFMVEDHLALIEREQVIFVRDAASGRVALVFGEPDSNETSCTIVVPSVHQLWPVLDAITRTRGTHDYKGIWTESES